MVFECFKRNCKLYKEKKLFLEESTAASFPSLTTLDSCWAIFPDLPLISLVPGPGAPGVLQRLLRS